MGDRKSIQSPLYRARMGLLTWLDLLPKDAQMSASMALDKFGEVAEREIEQPYFDGCNYYRAQKEAASVRASSPAPVGNAGEPKT